MVRSSLLRRGKEGGLSAAISARRRKWCEALSSGRGNKFENLHFYQDLCSGRKDLNFGQKYDRIIKIGQHLKEVLNAYSKKIARSTILNKLGLKKEKYFVLSCHREENIDSQIIFPKMIEVLSALAEKYKRPIIFSAHPRTQKKLLREKAKLPNFCN